MPGRIGLEAGMRRRPPAAALVEQRDVIKRRIEHAAMVWRDAATRAAMQENRGFGAGRSHPFPIDHMAVSDIEMTGSIGLDLRIECPQGLRHIFNPSAGQTSVS